MFVMIVNRDYCTDVFEDLVCKEFDMKIQGVGCGTVDFSCEKRPKNFKKRLNKVIQVVANKAIGYGTLGRRRINYDSG